MYNICADPERGGGAGGLDPPPPLEDHKAIGILSNTDPDPKATNPEFNLNGVSLACR